MSEHPELAPDTPLSLKEAAQILLRGVVKASTLRAAAARGELEIEIIGRRLVTTPAYIEAWRMKCRDRAKELVSTSAPPALGRPRDGLSVTEAAKLAQAAAKEKLKALKESLRPTSPKNTRQRGKNASD